MTPRRDVQHALARLEHASIKDGEELKDSLENFATTLASRVETIGDALHLLAKTVPLPNDVHERIAAIDRPSPPPRESTVEGASDIVEFTPCLDLLDAADGEQRVCMLLRGHGGPHMWTHEAPSPAAPESRLGNVPTPYELWKLAGEDKGKYQELLDQHYGHIKREPESRCERCGWPLTESRDKGCVAGDCSYRPHDGSPEWQRMKERDAELKAKREADLALRKIAPPKVPELPAVPSGFEACLWEEATPRDEDGYGHDFRLCRHPQPRNIVDLDFQPRLRGGEFGVTWLRPAAASQSIDAEKIAHLLCKHGALGGVNVMTGIVHAALRELGVECK